MTLCAALATSAGCAGPKFESAPDAGVPEGVHAAGRGATGHVGSPDTTSDAGEANGGEGSARAPSSGARDAGTSAHDDGGAPAEDTSGGTGGTSAGRANEPHPGTGGSSTSSGGATATAGATSAAAGSGTGGDSPSAATGGAPAAGAGGSATAGMGGSATAGTGGAVPPGGGGTNTGGAPSTCGPAACPLLPPNDGADCTGCEVPASGCSYDACLLVGNTYFAECVAAHWVVTFDPCAAPSQACCTSGDGDSQCKKHGKGNGDGCGEDD